MKTYRNNRICGFNSSRLLLTVAACTVLMLTAQVANAQRRWSAEIRPGANVATQKMGGANLNTGFGFEGSVAYQFLPHLAAYAGWSWNKFQAAESLAGSNVDFVETGYLFGLQFIHPIAASKISYLLRAGGTYNHIETENAAGTIINDTGHGLGWQAGVGLAIPLGNRFRLIPEVRYRSLSRDMNIDILTTPVELNYVSAGIGLSFSL